MENTALREITRWHGDTLDLIENGLCKSPQFLKPYHFVLLALRLKRHGRSVTLPEKLQQYAARMHLWNAIDQEPPVQVTEYPTAGRFQPLAPLRQEQDVETLGTQIRELMRPSCRDNATVTSVDNLIVELLGNCYAHSEPTNGLYGLVCAQIWTGGDKAQIAIGDGGIGIRSSFEVSGLYQDRLAHDNACTLATEFSVTSKPGKGHAGYGLTLARDLIQQNSGVLHILSGNEFFSSQANSTSHGLLPSYLDGTLIVIEWNLARGFDVQAVYSSWPLPEGLNDDDFDL